MTFYSMGNKFTTH